MVRAAARVKAERHESQMPWRTPEEHPQEVAAESGSKSRWVLALATSLTYLLIPVGCAAGFHVADVTRAREDRAEQIPIDEAHPLKSSVAVVAAPVSTRTSGELTYWAGRDPSRYLADFKLEHPGYSFVPPSDHGHISGGEGYVDYWVIKREPGRAIVKTHCNHHEIGISSDTRATYEATESDIRLISYRVGSDNAGGILLGLVLTVTLALVGGALKGSLATSAPLPERVALRAVRWRKMAGALALSAFAFVLPSMAAGWWLWSIVCVAVCVPAVLAWDSLRLLELKAPKSQRDAQVGRWRKVAGLLSLIGLVFGVCGSVAAWGPLAFAGSLLFVLAGLVWIVMALQGSK